MNNPFQTLIIVLGAVAVLLLGFYLYAAEWASVRAKPAVYLSGSSYITDTTGTHRTTFHAGEAFIFNATVRRQPLVCWSDYTTRLDGELTAVTFPIRRGIIMSDKEIITTVKPFHDIPHNVPPGRYEFVQVAFPSCLGFSLTPYQMDTGRVTIDILPPLTK